MWCAAILLLIPAPLMWAVLEASPRLAALSGLDGTWALLFIPTELLLPDDRGDEASRASPKFATSG